MRDARAGVGRRLVPTAPEARARRPHAVRRYCLKSLIAGKAFITRTAGGVCAGRVARAGRIADSESGARVTYTARCSRAAGPRGAGRPAGPRRARRPGSRCARSPSPPRFTPPVPAARADAMTCALTIRIRSPGCQAPSPGPVRRTWLSGLDDRAAGAWTEIDSSTFGQLASKKRPCAPAPDSGPPAARPSRRAASRHGRTGRRAAAPAGPGSAANGPGEAGEGGDERRRGPFRPRRRRAPAIRAPPCGLRPRQQCSVLSSRRGSAPLRPAGLRRSARPSHP
jgi:hypothetical protein